MALDQSTLSDIVEAVLARLQKEGVLSQPVRRSSEEGVFEDVSDALAASQVAHQKWAGTSREVRDRVIASLREAMHQNAEVFARRELEETGLGRYDDKVVKIHNAASATPGTEDLVTQSWSGDKGLVVEEYAPYGVIAAVTPSTHPVPVLFNSLVIIIASGNSVVFNVHPAAKNVSAFALQLFHRVIRANGGPENLATMVRVPTLQSADTLFRHPAVRLIAATGGPGLVKAAFASGKKVVAAGPGNPPVVVDATADLDRAAKAIIEGASFDNNILCIAEKEAFVVDAIYDRFMEAMARHGAVKLSQQQIELLASKAVPKNERGEASVNKDFVGKNARVLAAAAGVTVPDHTRLLFGEARFDCVFVQEEQMMPYLPVVRVRDFDEAVALAVKAEHGFGHTAMIHSHNLDNITRFSKALNTTIVVVNGSSLAGLGGIGGEGQFSHTVSSPTGEGVCTPRDFARVRRLAVSGNLRIVP
jgi:acyl-CoA reductase-like NAD-dependent aldehyde dehydrogenase